MTDKKEQLTFGEMLEYFRRRAKYKSGARNRILSQEQFGIEVGKLVNWDNCSRDVVSKWESNRTKIDHDAGRDILKAIICILHQHGGINTQEEADALLQSGKYANLFETELASIDPTWMKAKLADSPLFHQIKDETHFPLQPQHFITRLSDELYRTRGSVEEDFLDPARSRPKDPEVLEIPFITLSMTASEANDMFFNPKFQPIQNFKKNEFGLFIEQLQQKESYLPNHYSQDRDQWKPYDDLNKENTITEIVESFIKEINISRKITKLPEINARFYTKGFFSNNLITSKFLSENGGIILADVLSLFHPLIFNTLDRSEIRNQKDKIAIMVLSPESSHKTPVSLFIDEFLKQNMEWHYVFQFEQLFFKLYEFNIGDLRSLKKRLSSILPETIRIIQNQEPDPKTLNYINEFKNTDMESIIFKENR